MKSSDIGNTDSQRQPHTPDDIRRLYVGYCNKESKRDVETTETDPWGKPLPTNNAPLNHRSYVIASHGEIGYMGSLRKRRDLIVDILCEPDETRRNQILQEAYQITQKVIIEYGELNRFVTEKTLTEMWMEERNFLEVAGIPTVLLDYVLSPTGGLKTKINKLPDWYCVTGSTPVESAKKPPLSESLRRRFGEWFNRWAA